MTGKIKKARLRKKPPPKPRNPLVPLAKARGHGVEPSAKSYRRKPKHKEPPPENGGS